MTEPRRRNARPRQPARPPRVRFYYERDPGHSIAFASGMFGGATPNGNIYIGFFVDHPPIPEQITHEIIDGRQLGPEVATEHVQRQEGFTRTISSEVIMTLETATLFRDWLQKNIDAITELKEQLEAGHDNDSDRP